ncbi:Site-specific recombinase XerD [Natronoarchaeum philippinense]|uniref:Site-specific recombinase XerD n=1 Tax=Natronoarchaeum philippinense TaxID=558529 RepID=A0A285NDT7_NATPI|nr:site-specific integrase [Natronoarchaeum philippinense]SNZ06086.1 Site-specific recombinase XerD [Natronoarchaeum philippinense]
MQAPDDLTPAEAREYYLDDLRADSSDHTIRSYGYRLTQFVEWCEEHDVEQVSEISGWTIDQFKRDRQSMGDEPVTVKGKMVAVKQLLDYCARIDAVDEDLPEKVDIPSLSRAEETSDTKLAAEDAQALLEYYRNDPGVYATNHHALLEVLWNTGARLSGIRTLDLEDYYPDRQFLDFKHRPETGTGLKNDEDGERPVSIPETVCDVLDAYIERDRWEKRDDHGRQPLFSCRQGRPSASTIRSWCYLATQPCLHQECPHGETRPTCEYPHRNKASQCPSSRSPHQVRTGSITWHRDRGIPMEVTAERVNASPDVIERHYDKASAVERMEKRRRKYVQDLDFGDNSEQ